MADRRAGPLSIRLAAALTLGLLVGCPIATHVAAAAPAPSGTPLPAPSPVATHAPTVDPAPAPTSGVYFDDPLDDPASGFATGDYTDQRVAYAGGRLVLTLRAAHRFTLSMRALGATTATLRVEATLARPILAGEAYVGLACAATDGSYLAGLLGAGGDWVLMRVDDGGPHILARSEVGAAALAPGPLDMAIECAGAGTQRPGVALDVDGVLLGAVADPSAPAAFAEAGVYAETGRGSRRLKLRVDEIVARPGSDPLGIPSADPEVSAGPPATELLLHVPTDVRAHCHPTATPPPGVAGEVMCTPTSGADTARFRSYATGALLESDFAASRAAHAADATGGDCSIGPAQGTWAVDGQTRGEVICYREGRSATIEWTDEALRIGGMASRDDGSFSDLDAWWADAGPVP